ncbi:MAG: hypothetical protein A2381_03960 [Bdellovibrionales bacterium RIFOXYB1_FULL_37_110]|nr:MAG: hypothetical protein A2417_10070 [Bdellovibrionales bacterium RIFOXYC1_FULL_37_79]OFZ59079.1 MAG: hypothetical protein A2381_03960 [Bdellovibrionales bacterium RIFOXYB1_FULL_37_110]OFZ64086.1 MAG: hypothetical protein A2577_15080 [Bdellovibrionales bacterium RIFOXYD1_FULL_36_51]
MEIKMKVITINLFLLMFILSSCAPTVRVEAPDKPIEINLNVNIEHNVKIQMDKQLDNLMKNQKDIF